MITDSDTVIKSDTVIETGTDDDQDNDKWQLISDKWEMIYKW